MSIRQKLAVRKTMELTNKGQKTESIMRQAKFVGRLNNFPVYQDIQSNPGELPKTDEGKRKILEKKLFFIVNDTIAASVDAIPRILKRQKKLNYYNSFFLFTGDIVKAKEFVE